ncbi:MAG: hypothetical protein ACFFCT_13925 [Candidatus Odinarchaeota archaeon]
MNSNDLAQWLLQNAGPCIRFRTLVEILHEQDVSRVSQALQELLGSPEVVEWTSRLNPQFDINSIHSGKPNAFENVIGKLVQLGLRAGLQPFDNKTLPFRVWLSENVEVYPETPHAVFLRTIIAAFLAFAGYDSIDPVMTQMTKRLQALYLFAKDPDFASVFVDKSETNGFPEGSENHQLVNPELYQDQQFMLPWIHDIRGLSSCIDILSKQSYVSKTEKIVEMILTSEYQSLPSIYGLAKYGKRYYVLGWAVHLPGYSAKPEGRSFAELLLTLEVMGKFPVARKSPWFVNSIEYLESFRTEYGTYIFPSSWLPEKQTGYWVGGLRMGYDERKSYPKAIECESTFRMLKIKQIAGGT